MNVGKETKMAQHDRDLTRRPQTFLAWWGAPIALGLGSNFFSLSTAGVAAVWSGALAWMGVGCAVNAVRCQRVHCYISAPALLLGAIAAGLIATGAIDLGVEGINIVIGAAAAATLASFIPEYVWRRNASG